ncbi:MAG: acetyl-CoA carboxylase biotin carboxylase subunit [Chloroflexi bacterium]|nr:acetyl-CoA carboxylase biotin carboxylase subunit [Chloroflexota bacterium]
MFRKLLIANRGEIAVRIARACREMGIATVAVYSEADRDALHLSHADEAVLIGPPPAAQSYLQIERIIAAARDSGCDAVHPGYGFLAERAEFAQAVADAGLIFVGPPASAIRAMGDKTSARALMQAAGVPTVPGYQRAAPRDDDRDFVEAAERLGYPVLVKASAGGGGKGMRTVADAGGLADALESARREALNAFGDAAVYLEKLLVAPHHVEFQVLADAHGGIVHLLERECSVQRRHQKIIEETPSPLLTPELRAQMGAAAVAAARACGYVNAGTIEFLVDSERRFYFLEMNTRLQVEHPITEAITGIDLVQAQLRIASGEPLWFAQDDVRGRGHAIECRVYAEDPANGFLPSIGDVRLAEEPRGPGIRVDAGVATGRAVTRFYDPLIAKVIAHAETRDGALARMQRALADYAIIGVTTNIRFLRAVLAHPAFRRGETTTQFVDEQFANWTLPAAPLPDEVLIAAAIAELQARPAAVPATAEGDAYNPWRVSDGFRLGRGS